jgi:hypothetical protein
MDGNPLRDYLLILNPGKCGSTWLAKTLSVQPFLATRGELDFIFFLEYPLEKQWNRRTADDPAFLRIREDVRQSPLEKLVGLYRLQRERHPDLRMLIDKSPSNVLSFPRYYDAYRDSRIVVMYRDPRDVYVSLELFHQRVLEDCEPHESIGDGEFLRHWSHLWHAVKNCRMTLECEKLLQRAKIPYLRLTYEQLLDDFEATVRRVLDFSGLGLTDQDLVQSPGVDELRPLAEHLDRAKTVRPLFRKGVAGDWSNHLTTDEAKDIVKELAGDLLIELGYESDYRW